MDDTTMKEVRKMKTAWIPLHHKVIAVAVEGNAGDWSAYIRNVPGVCHREEWGEVVKTGAKLPQIVAEVLFPQFAHLQWRN